MKKLRGIMLLTFCCLFSGVIALSACSSCSENPDDSTSVSTTSSGSGTGSTDDTNYDTMLESISVNSTGAKTSYTVGEEFSADGLVVTATTSVNFITSTSTVTGYTVDSGNYDSSKVGTYTIYVSYALPEKPLAIQNASYTVTVSSQLPAYANMDATYSGEQQLTYSTSGVTIDLSASLITVTSHIGDDAANLETETVTDYTLYYSANGGEEVAVENNAVTATEIGVYSVYAVKDYTVDSESITMRAQLIFFVVDTAVSIAKNEGGTTSYDYGATNIGSDWTYTLTFASGATQTLTASDVTIDASAESGSQTATITYVYSYTGIKNGEVTTVSDTLTTTVAYTMAAASATSITSYAVELAGSAANASSTSYEANAQITKNDVFTITSLVATTYSVGASYGNISATSTASQNVSYTGIDGKTTVVPDQGIRCSNITANTSQSVFSVTANAACTIQIYVTYANEGFSSNKEGTVWYNLNSATSNVDVLTYDKSDYKRGSVATISLTLAKGDVVVIGATAVDSGALWLWGAQAIAA